MTIRAIKQMQDLAWKSAAPNGYVLGPYILDEDVDKVPRVDPFTHYVDLGSTRVTLVEYWEATRHNTRAIVANYPDVFDIAERAPALYDGLLVAQGSAWKMVEGAKPSSSSGVFFHFESLPLVGPFSVMPGWWQMSEDRALCITQRGDMDSFLVWNVVDLPPLNDGNVSVGRRVWPTQAMLTVSDQGDVKLHDTEAMHTLNMLLVDFAVACIAMSIMQSDPDVVVTGRRHRAKKKPSRIKKRKPAYESVRTIALPGLRYEQATGSWRAKRSDGVAWHMVRGHYRLLKSEKYRNKQGQKVWVKPHSRGRESAGPVARKRYVIGNAG